MNDKDELIASLRKQLREALRKCSAQEQEIALLNHLFLSKKSITNINLTKSSIRQSNYSVMIK